MAVALNAFSDGVTMALRNQTRLTHVFRVALNLMSFILIAYVLINGNVFNTELAAQVAPNSVELKNLWIWVQRNIVVVIVIANIIGIAIQTFQIARFNRT